VTLPKLSVQLTDADLMALESHYATKWVNSLRAQPGEFGLKYLPRDPMNPDRMLPKFQTDKHTYTIVGENGIGIDRYTQFQKRSVQRGFGRDFQSIIDTLNAIYRSLGTDSSKSDAIVQIRALMDSVADFGNDQFDAALWICTLFVLREDETLATYSEQMAEEKIQDWKDYGFSELDFFLLSGSVVPGYGTLFTEVLRTNKAAQQRLLDVIAMSGSEAEK
jgi:hypothetical protein